jgi:hypothetical protein
MAALLSLRSEISLMRPHPQGKVGAGEKLPPRQKSIPNSKRNFHNTTAPHQDAPSRRDRDADAICKAGEPYREIVEKSHRASGQ